MTDIDLSIHQECGYSDLLRSLLPWQIKMTSLCCEIGYIYDSVVSTDENDRSTDKVILNLPSSNELVEPSYFVATNGL